MMGIVFSCLLIACMRYFAFNQIIGIYDLMLRFLINQGDIIITNQGDIFSLCSEKSGNDILLALWPPVYYLFLFKHDWLNLSSVIKYANIWSIYEYLKKQEYQIVKMKQVNTWWKTNLIKKPIQNFSYTLNDSILPDSSFNICIQFSLLKMSRTNPWLIWYLRFQKLLYKIS